MRRLASPADLVGEWFLVASSPALQQRLDLRSARMLLSPMTSRGQLSFVEFTTPRRTFRFRSSIPVQRDDQTRYRWSGVWGLGFIAASNWELSSSESGSVVCAQQPPSMLMDGGHALLARVELPRGTHLATIRRELRPLGLSEADHRDLAWFPRPDPLDHERQRLLDTRMRRFEEADGGSGRPLFRPGWGGASRLGRSRSSRLVPQSEGKRDEGDRQ